MASARNLCFGECGTGEYGRRDYGRSDNRYYATVHEYTGLFYQMFYAVGPAADARRARALPLIAQEPERVPDGIVSGPEIPLGEAVKRRFFGEE